MYIHTNVSELPEPEYINITVCVGRPRTSLVITSGDNWDTYLPSTSTLWAKVIGHSNMLGAGRPGAS